MCFTVRFNLCSGSIHSCTQANRLPLIVHKNQFIAYISSIFFLEKGIVVLLNVCRKSVRFICSTQFIQSHFCVNMLLMYVLSFHGN